MYLCQSCHLYHADARDKSNNIKIKISDFDFTLYSLKMSPIIDIVRPASSTTNLKSEETKPSLDPRCGYSNQG